MWCRHVRSQLSAYADGELSCSISRAVEEHLLRCERCARERASLQRGVRLMSLVPEEEIPAGLHARILSRLARLEPAPAAPVLRSHRPAWLNPWAGVTLAGATAALALGFFHSRAGVPPVTPLADSPGPEVRRSQPAPLMAEYAPAAPTREVRKPAIRKPRAGRTEPLARVRRHVRPGERKIARAGHSAPRSVQVVRLAKSAPPVRVVRPQPIAALISGRPVIEPRASEPVTPIAMSDQKALGMPGDPVVNSSGPVGPAEPAMAGTEKETSTRMAGTPGEGGEAPSDEDEGLRPLRMFLEERNRSVPQPPVVMPSRERRMRKSL